MTDSFQAFKSEPQFDPVDQAGPGLIQSAEQNQNSFNASLDNYHKQLYEYELAAGKRKDQRLDKIAHLSATAAEAIKPTLDARRERAQMEGAQLWKDDLAENGDLLRSDYNNKEQALKNIEIINNKVVGDAVVNNEIDGFLAERLRNLPGSKRKGYVQAMLQEHALQYPIFFQTAKHEMKVPIIDPDEDFCVEMTLADAKDPNHYSQILQRINRAYIRPFSHLNQVEADKHLYESMRTFEEGVYQDWATDKETALDNKRKEFGKRTLLASVKSGNGGEALRNFAELYQSDHDGITGAYQEGFKILEDQVKLGLVTEDQLEAIASDTFAHRGLGGEEVRMDDPRAFQAGITKLREALIDRKVKEFERKNSLDKVEFSKAEADFFDNLPDEPTDDEIEAAQEILVKNHGKRSAKLDSVKKDLTLESKLVKEAMKQAKDLADLGLLTPKRLVDNFPWQVQRSMADVARLQSTASPYNKVHIKGIERMTAAGAKVLADGTADHTAGILAAQLQNKYMKRVQELKVANVENPELTAYTEINNEFETYWNVPDKGKNQDGYKVLMDLPVVNKTTADANLELNKLKTTLRIGGDDTIYYEDSIFKLPELKAMEKGFGKQGWTPHPKATYVGEVLGIDPLSVINAQRAAHDLPLLQETDSFKAFNNISPAYQKILCSYNSTDRSCRAWGSTGKFNEEIIPNKLAEKVKEVAAKNKLNPALVAGMIENNYDWNTLSDDDLQSFNFDTPLNTEILKSAYKYGYKEALDNPYLIRPTVQSFIIND